MKEALSVEDTLKLALEALETWQHFDEEDEQTHEAITAIKEALAQPDQTTTNFGYDTVKPYTHEAQPEQDPVARLEWIVNHGWHTTLLFPAGSIPAGSHNLYTTPPQRKPLTDEEIQELFGVGKVDATFTQFVRAIEAAHGIKEQK